MKPGLLEANKNNMPHYTIMITRASSLCQRSGSEVEVSSATKFRPGL